MITDWRGWTPQEIGRTAHHIYLHVHPLLRPYIAHYTIWTAEGEQTDKELLNLVPDASGCVVLHIHRENNVQGSLWGATTRIATVNNGTQGPPVRVFIEFLPGGLYQLTGMPQKMFTDGIFSLSDLLPKFFREIEKALEVSICLGQLVQQLDDLLLSILLQREMPCTAFSATCLLKNSYGMLTVEELAAKENYSLRHLNRVLNDYLGMGAKQFARLMRINTVAHLLHSNMSLTLLAQESGYYDQAHFIRDFSKVCGVTPSDYRANMSVFYNEPLKF